MSFFDSLQLLPDDPIFGLPAVVAQDPRPNKVNLGIGVYRDAEGKASVFSAVRKAEASILEQKLNKDYQLIEGHQGFLKEALKLVFGPDSLDRDGVEFFAAQTIGGTGALRLGTEFLTQEISKTIHISEPSWPNHKPIFVRAGMKVHYYPYYDQKTHQIEFSRLCGSIKTMAPGSVILLHGCCHNPTGTDLSKEQWQELSKLIKEQKVIPFFDLAYQGFDAGLDDDAYAVRYFFSEGHEMLVSSSYSKNMGLYGERLGVLIVVSRLQGSARKVGSQVRQIIRGAYSTPPLQSARIAYTILTSPELSKEWKEELGNIRERIKEMRKTLVAGLLAQANEDFSFLTHQKGLFSFCGLNQDQVAALRKQYAIFMPDNGRINVAGLNAQNIDYAINSILAVIHS